MTRKKLSTPETPIEMDLPRIEQALRQLYVLAWEQNAPHIGPDGCWTGGEDRTEIGCLIRHPVLMAARLGITQMQSYLVRTIGPVASNEIVGRLNAEHQARREAHVRMPEPDQARH